MKGIVQIAQKLMAISVNVGACLLKMLDVGSYQWIFLALTQLRSLDTGTFW